jgi:hypothetical protein
VGGPPAIPVAGGLGLHPEAIAGRDPGTSMTASRFCVIGVGGVS